MSETKPQGIVGIYTCPDGYVIATVADFDTSGAGGFSKRDAQEYRVRAALARAVVQAYASDRLWKALDGRRVEILDRLCRDGGKATYMPIGYGDGA